MPNKKSGWVSTADGMMKKVGGAIGKVIQIKGKVDNALQNYGRNIRKNIDADNAEFQQKRGTKGFNNYQAKNPFPNPFDKKSYE